MQCCLVSRFKSGYTTLMICTSNKIILNQNWYYYWRGGGFNNKHYTASCLCPTNHYQHQGNIFSFWSFCPRTHRKISKIFRRDYMHLLFRKFKSSTALHCASPVKGLMLPKWQHEWWQTMETSHEACLSIINFT